MRYGHAPACPWAGRAHERSPACSAAHSWSRTPPSTGPNGSSVAPRLPAPAPLCAPPTAGSSPSPWRVRHSGDRPRCATTSPSRACECPHRTRRAASAAGPSPLAEPARLSLSDKSSSTPHALHSASHGTARKAPCSCPPGCGLQSPPGEAPRSAPVPRRLARVPARSTFAGPSRPKRPTPTPAQAPTHVRRCWRSAGPRPGNPRCNASCAGP